VADITYVAIAGGFAYVAVILDGWSRRVVGYAISHSIDARLTLAALAAAIEDRKPPPGCVHHSDRGSQYAAAAYRDQSCRPRLSTNDGAPSSRHDFYDLASRCCRIIIYRFA
jgi:putative transposase